jgi:dihydroxyacetone kinase-like predicted kinase
LFSIEKNNLYRYYISIEKRGINMPEQSIQYRYDTQLLIDGHDLDEDAINDYITENFVGDCLLVVGDEDLIKLHYHTNEPWKVLEYCSTLGEIYDIVVEDIDRQTRGLHG